MSPRALDAVRAVIAHARRLSVDDDRYSAARARAEAEKPDRMRFTPSRPRRSKAAERRARQHAESEFVRELHDEHRFDKSYLEHRYGAGR